MSGQKEIEAANKPDKILRRGKLFRLARGKSPIYETRREHTFGNVQDNAIFMGI